MQTVRGRHGADRRGDGRGRGGVGSGNDWGKVSGVGGRLEVGGGGGS